MTSREIHDEHDAEREPRNPAIAHLEDVTGLSGATLDAFVEWTDCRAFPDEEALKDAAIEWYKFQGVQILKPNDRTLWKYQANDMSSTEYQRGKTIGEAFEKLMARMVEKARPKEQPVAPWDMDRGIHDGNEEKE